MHAAACRQLTGAEARCDTAKGLHINRPDQDDCGVPRRLIFAGKQMGDEKQAKDYNVEGGSVLHLVSSCLQAANMLSAGFLKVRQRAALMAVCLCHLSHANGGALMVQVLALRGGSQQ